MITLRDRARPQLVYGYRVGLTEGWEGEMPPALLAGLTTHEICEIIEAASIGLPLDARPGEIRWIEDD